MYLLLLAAVAAIAAYAYHSTSKSSNAVQPTVIAPAPTTPDAIEQTDPDPNTVPLPDPTDQAEVVPDAEAAVEPDPTATAVTPEVIAPKYDVTAFFERARKIMQDRTKPAITVYRSDLKANLAGLERALTREVRKVNMSDHDTDKVIEKVIAAWTANDGRIPDQLGEKLIVIPEAATVFAEAVQKQIGTDDTLQLELAKQAAIYITGLEKQIERLKPDNDVGAIQLIEAEIKQTKESPKYFSELMLSTP